VSNSKDRESVALVGELLEGRIDRRRFVRDALLMGMGLSTIGTVLSACGGDEKKPEPSRLEGGPTPGPGGAAPAPVMEKELNIYIWSDYLAEDTVPNFEKETGVKVVVDTYESNEEAVAKLQSGASTYDLVCPSGYAVEVMRALDLIEKIDHAKTPNVKNILAAFKDVPYDPGGLFTMPWLWGITGIAYRKDRVKGPVDSWAVFQDAQYKNKMTQMDDMRDVIGGWLKFRGKSLNSIDAAELAQAKADALLAKANLQSYISGPVKSSLIAGDVLIAMLWDGDTAQATRENPEIGWVLPKEGASIWTDSMVIPKSAPHKNAAHAFLDYIMRPEVAAKLASGTGYGSPNEAALPLMTNPTRMPEGAQKALVEYQKDLGANAAAWDQVWTEIKAG